VITITGVNLGSATVKINGVVATILTRTATQMTVKVPNTTSGPLTVTNTGGTATWTSNFVVLPRITAFSPAKGAVGVAVTIVGTTFGGASDVQFNGQSVGAGNFTLVSPTKITTTVPANATSGKLSVVTPAGTAHSVGLFQVAPRITSVTPGSARVGATVTISGANLQGASVKIGTIAQTVVSASATGEFHGRHRHTQRNAQPECAWRSCQWRHFHCAAVAR
jgi:hypothetical protein